MDDQKSNINLESDIKSEIKKHLILCGFYNSSLDKKNKENYRSAHHYQRQEKLQKNKKFLDKKWKTIKPFLADGCDVIPEKIKIRIELAKSKKLSGDLFRVVGLNWSVPTSEGYGRRMRFLVWDDSNDKLIGIFALGDAVYNLKVRDTHIGWDEKSKKDRLVNVMDAYILGAIPPYSNLLGGKLIASIIKSQEVVHLFREKYKESVGVISGKKKNPHLTMISVTSALGRSSIYNRLTLSGDKIFTKIGETSGYGHFQFSDALFSKLVNFLNTKNIKIEGSSKFGKGPNWRIRIIRSAFKELGLASSLLKHGFLREVYISLVADNAIEVLKGIKKRPDYQSLKSIAEIQELAKDRWVIPRSKRNDEYKNFKVEDFYKRIST